MTTHRRNYRKKWLVTAVCKFFCYPFKSKSFQNSRERERIFTRVVFEFVSRKNAFFIVLLFGTPLFLIMSYQSFDLNFPSYNWLSCIFDLYDFHYSFVVMDDSIHIINYPYTFRSICLLIGTRTKHDTVLNFKRQSVMILFYFFFLLLQEGGLRALYRGFLPTVMGMIPYAGFSFYCFEYLKYGCMKYFPKLTCDPCQRNTGKYRYIRSNCRFAVLFMKDQIHIKIASKF